MTPPTDLAAGPEAAPIPLVDLSVQHAQVAGEVAEGWARVTASGAFILGPDVTAFEEEFAAFSAAAHCIGVGNGTDALELALRARGIGEGDEVVVPANTFIATAEAVSRVGALPVLADCDPTHLLVDPARVAERITDRTRAVMAVHLYGQMAPVDALAAVLPDGVDLIEDAAQSQGATHHGRSSGSVGAVAGTSFYPGKNLGAYGDAGAVLTNDATTAGTVRALRAHGGTRKYTHDLVGVNSRLDTLQAVVLRAKLARLAGWNEQRRAAARRYDDLLGGRAGIGLPATLPGNVHVWHLYVVRVARRDEVLARLDAAGIGAGIHYPQPVHLLGAYAHLGHAPGDFPVAEAAAGEILSLPLFPGITGAQQERVAAELIAAVDGAA
ncbi:MAG TPA: DegT/DnrJ/EryC1/StrS family aminotransferase [Acidimicrobiales bacterium]|nr:DegT/DnrJ/EryC1/StrS family aminotransferase [Acidimicrobiales bacterium]